MCIRDRSGIYKLRKHVEQVDETSETDEEVGDDFENLYKGEISKSGVPILPSKRARKIPEKIQVEKDDLKDLNNDSDQLVATEPQETEEGDLSLDQIKEEEISSEENQIKFSLRKLFYNFLNKISNNAARV